MTSYRFVPVNEFTPNTPIWTSIQQITSYIQIDNTFNLKTADGLSLVISFLSNKCFRLRFNPQAGVDYSTETSLAVVNRHLGAVHLSVKRNGQTLHIDTGAMAVQLQLESFSVSVYRNGQLINADVAGQGIVYIPGQTVIANFKIYPANAKFCGCGETAGAQLLKNNCTMTAFNFDNYKYISAPVPIGTQGGPLNPSEALYTSIPFLMEHNPAPQDLYSGRPYTYAIFFDNPGQSFFNLGASDYSDMYGKFYFGALYGDLDYYFILGDSPGDVLTQYTTLTGRSPMPPKYVFGFHQGAYGYFDWHKLAIVAHSYRRARIPIDGLHIDVDFQNNYRTFTHSDVKFPSISDIMNNLHSMGFKCSTIVTPLLTDNPLDETGNVTPYTPREELLAIDGLLVNNAGEGVDPSLFEGRVNYGMNFGTNPYRYPPLQPNNQGYTPLGATGSFPDFQRQDVRDTWGKQYAHLIDDVGMDMIWQDMTCPGIEGIARTLPLGLEQGNIPHAVIHNHYALNLLRATWEGLQRLRPDRRNFILARGGYAGLQRYAGLWTGDSASDWNFLRVTVPQVLNLGLSGIPISGADVGGFATSELAGTDRQNYMVNGHTFALANYELLTRWMQLGSFLPWFRNHYDGYNKQFQEVYAYAEPVPTNCRKYVELRYRMLQVYYDAMYEWTQTGMPIARALFLNDPQDPNVFRHLDDEFFVGKDCLVAPILNQHETLPNPTAPLRSVYLPSGSQWYSFKDHRAKLDTPVEGGTLITNYYAGLDLVPMYVRAGAILPFRELEQYVGQLRENPLTFNIYPGPDSSYRVYLDDGYSTNAEARGTYRLSEVTHQGISGGQNIRVRRLYDRFTPAEGFYFVALLGTRHPSSVTVASTGVPEIQSPEALAGSGVNAYYWNADIEITFIKIFDTTADMSISALYL
jgi:alpha-glucosidase